MTDSSAMSGEAAEQAVTAAAGQQEIFLGIEHDACSGQLSVYDRYNVWVTIPRGQVTTVDVALTGEGYWLWSCGRSDERSRGDPDYRSRVKRLKILHSPDDRGIDWQCYDLL
jgi:hypothetical protein